MSCLCPARLEILIDNALPPRLAALPRLAGRDAAHVRDDGMQAAKDQLVPTRALEEDRVPVSADTDFGTLAAQEASRPSFILFWDTDLLSAEDYVGVLPPSRPLLEPELPSGCAAVFRSGRLRVRRLPISAG